MIEKLNSEGYLIVKKFFEKEKIEGLLENSKKIFEIQFNSLEYEGTFEEKIFKLFNEHEDVFINCGKIIQQGLVDLYSLAFDSNLILLLKNLGLKFPVSCTRPVLYFNHPKLAKKEVYYKTPLHQDWPSMQSSSDSLVVWVPLIDVNDQNGSIIIYPKTHTLGNVSDNNLEGFGVIEKLDMAVYEEVQPTLEVGDIAIFSTFLIHKSGEIKNDQIRWSCHFRYTNMLDKDFIDRGFPNPYIYKPIIKK